MNATMNKTHRSERAALTAGILLLISARPGAQSSASMSFAMDSGVSMLP
jgi:hypothetical protein